MISDRDMAEIALAHSIGTEVKRVYRRIDMLDRRRAMGSIPLEKRSKLMTNWARQKATRGDGVVALGGGL